jgi:hypothetical protein
VQPHPFPLARGQCTRLVPDGVGDAETAQVVDETGPVDRRHLVGPQTQRGRRVGGQPGDGARVTQRVGRLEVHEVGHCLECLVELAIHQHPVEQRLRGQRRGPGVHRVELGEE